MWSPEGHIGYYAEVWAGEDFERYMIFPVPEDMTDRAVLVPFLEGARAVVLSKRGSMCVSSVVWGWKG